jgi:hypothetical protein
VEEPSIMSAARGPSQSGQGGEFVGFEDYMSEVWSLGIP